MSWKLALILAFLAQSAWAVQPFCVAHRSLGFGGLENSLSALENASTQQADAIEFDVVHTKDMKSIIYHDKSLKRLAVGETCPLREKIKDLQLEDIREKCLLKNGEKIPLLEEGLEILSLGQSLLFIEFKDSIITKNDVEIIKKYYGDRPEKVAIISFHEEVLSLVKQWSLSDDFLSKIKTVLLKKFGFFRGQKSADFLSAKYIHKSRAQRLRNKGMLVGAYTKNEVDKIEKYLDKDLDFITTNEYKRCRELVEKRK